MKTPIPDNVRLERAKRVWSIRQLTGLSRRLFAKKYGIASGTVQNWEDKNGHGLMEKGAYRLARCLQTGGIQCSVEWLLHGTGPAPQEMHTSALSTVATQKRVDGNKEPVHLLEEELELFCTHYPDAVYYQIADDSMLPYYQMGDYVAGIRHYNEDIKPLIGSDCIVLLDTGAQMVRQLRASHIPGTFDLAATHLQTKNQQPYLYNVTLVYAAPIIWLRRLPLL